MEKRTKNKLTKEEEFKEIFSIILKDYCDIKKEAIELGYNSDGEFVLNLDGTKVMDRYLEVPVKIDNMVILPGSIIVLDDNELSLSKYLEEFGDVL